MGIGSKCYTLTMGYLCQGTIFRHGSAKYVLHRCMDPYSGANPTGEESVFAKHGVLIGFVWQSFGFIGLGANLGG